MGALMLALAFFGLMAAPARASETSEAAAEEIRPFDEEADAGLQVDAALRSAQANGKLVLLVLGGNWCHDSRGLAAKFADPTLAPMLAEKYQIAWIDVGRRDRNLDIATRFGVERIIGTPTVLILSADGLLLNADTVHDWRNAASRSLDETRAYFSGFDAASLRNGNTAADKPSEQLSDKH